MEKNEYGCVKTQITRKCVDVAESIEEMVRRCTENNTPIEASAPMVYTEEKDGVLPQYNIRADKFEIALDAVDKYNASQVAKNKGVETKKVDDPSGQATTVVAE